MTAFRKTFLATAALVVTLAMPCAAETEEKGFIRVKPEELQWKNPLGVGPSVAVISGDPAKPGGYLCYPR